MRKIRVGLIGTGGIAQGSHIPGYRSIPDECEVVWACDVDRDLAERVAKEHGIARTTCDYRDLLSDPELDAVSVTTPNRLHFQPTVDALRAGKHVLCEKPLAMYGDEARAMCRAARESGKTLMVGLQMRFGGPARFMKDFISAGHMGEIYYARAQALRRRGVPGWGVFIDREQQGGGPLIDIGVHILDLTLFQMGHSKPVSATGRTWDMLGRDPNLWNGMGDYDRDKFRVEDMAVGLIRFANGAAVTIESSFMANLKDDVFQTQLFGTKSGAVVKGWGEEPVEVSTERDRQLFDMRPRNVPKVASDYAAEVQAFVRAVREGLPSPVPGEQGLVLNAVFDALYSSSVTGREEPIDVTV